MKKITLLLLFIFFSITGYSQLTEGFENTTGPDALPSTNWTLGSGNWAVFDNAVGTAQRWGNAPVATPSNAYQGDNAAYINRENLGTEGLISQDYLATPLVTIPANGQLRFFARSFTSGNQGTLYQIRVAPATASQTNPAAYTLVQQWDETTLNTTFNVYEEKIVDLTAYATQQVYVSFVRVHTQLPGGINGAGDRWLVDNVNIVQRCLDPTTLTFSAVTQNGATLNWANPSGATSWEIEVILATATPTGTGVIYNGTLPYVVTGLLANTAYKFYVRAICNTGYSSQWSVASATFTTGTAPPECGGNFVDAGGTTANYPNNSNSTTTICPTVPGDKVTVTFTAFNTEASFDGLYVYNGNGVVPANLIASANPAANVPGGLAGSYWGTTIPGPFSSSAADGCLTFVFRSDGSVNNPGWIANITCAPPPVCQQPTTLVSSAVTSNSATLAWTNVGVATTWEVIALPCTAPAPNETTTGFITTSTNPYTFTGLSSATCYNLYVRGNCSSTSNGVSLWSGPRSVTTQVAPPECGGNFVDAGGPTANYPNNSNTTTTICPTVSGDKVTVTFTSFNTEANWDGLYVYNGNGVVPANLIASANPAANVPGGLAGSYWGTTIPGPFTSSAADGCLTFVFRSDGSVNNPGWVANVTCAPPPVCQQPTTLVSSAVTSNSATLAWTNVGVATTWEVIALPCTAPAPDASTTGFIATSTNPYTFTGLVPATCYNLYVRGNCSSTSNGVSLWSGPRTITTLVAPPECGGNFVDAGGPTANYPNNSNTTTIICPTNPGEIVTVTFTSFNTEANWDGLYVYDGNGVVPANQIASANPAANVPGGLAGSYWGTTIPGPFTSTAADGCLTFVFRSDGSVNNPGWVSNITCSPAPTCARPTLVTATNVTQTSAILNWTQPLNPNGSLATAWEVLILPAGSPVPTTNGIPATSPYTASGLSAGTAYVFYVRAICSSTDSSVWSALNFAALPVNDECSNATFAIVNQNLNCVQTTPGTLSGATASLPTTTCPGVANDDVWFTFTATAVTHVISFNNVSLPAPTLNYAIFSGSDCGALTQVGCNSGANLIPGTTYFIRVYSATAVPQFTTFNLCIGTLPCTEAPAFCTGQTVTYANATNVPSLGQIGCLFTSPNPAFFFLQVNQAGPLSYLISQVDNNGVPRDVDYVAWGPFTDLNAACSGVPANPLPAANPIPTPTTGCPGTIHACSYSIAPQEIMCIPNAQLCQVYVIMITNFSNQAGTVTFTQTNTGGGTTECFPINTFNYPQTYYCQNGGANPTPVLAPGAAAGTYTSTAGLVIDPVTGVIDLAASTPGAYIVTSTTLTSTAGVCTNIPSIITTRTVIITGAANATIAYASPTYCNSSTSFENPTQTGTTGGVYTASPAGLLINQVTGGILPIASTPGIYTITYTIPAFGGCAAFTTTTQVEILASPVIVQPAPVSVCNSYTLPALTVGNYYSQSGGVGTPLDINVPITSSQTVYIYANSNGCSNEKSFNVSIGIAPTPTLNVTQTTCSVQTGTIEVTAPLGTGGGLPSNLFISEVTDEDVGSLTYIEIFNGTGAAVDLSNYKLKVYNNGNSTASCDNQLTGILNNNSTFVVAVGSVTNQGGVVPNQVFASCGGVNTDDNIRLTTSTDVEIDNWGRTDGVAFTPSNQPGYTYRRNNTATVPSLTWNTSDWTAIDPQDYTNVGSYTPLVTGYQYSLDNGTYQSGTIFNNVLPGDHTVTVLDLASGCLSVPVTVTINPVPVTPTVLTFSYTTPVCKNATTNPTPITVSGFTPNGVYSSTTGLSIDASTGLINLANSTPGTYTVTYTVAPIPSICLVGGSSTAEITINPVITPVTTFSYSSPICSFYADNLAQPILSTGFTLGGVFSSTAGLSINPDTGVITVSGSSPGNYTITYFIAANPSLCQLEATSTAQVTITAPFEISVESGCQSVNYVLTALPVANSFNPETVTYSWQNANGLIIGNTQSITVTETGSYFVSITSDGCSSNSLPVSVDSVACVIQKGISVNNDGKNDTFDLTGFNVKNLSIFNRYGEKVYSYKNYTNQWGGQSDKGDELPDGTYYYVINRDNGETKTGWIYINRAQ
ncbi:fibronectin type III domain-containing protein [Flavobacterium sp. RSB2_4_14]|uniref:fibronectin type III domain-containing protein n=1 Tax=Flavobacterium sp. RSB2_4_14 TaxID=3447665 RepID=UPI003F360269